jgi:hypothetical protein
MRMMMEFVQTSLIEKMEKKRQLENEECQQNSSYNSSHVGEGSLVKPNESSKSLQFGIFSHLHPYKKLKKS